MRTNVNVASYIKSKSDPHHAAKNHASFEEGDAEAFSVAPLGVRTGGEPGAGSEGGADVADCGYARAPARVGGFASSLRPCMFTEP